MPKAPILSRTLLYTKIRSGNRNPTYRLLDFCLVQTELGPALEPRTITLDNGALTNDDANDSSFNAIMEVSEGALQEQFGSQGVQQFVEFGL